MDLDGPMSLYSSSMSLHSASSEISIPSAVKRRDKKKERNGRESFRHSFLNAADALQWFKDSTKSSKEKKKQSPATPPAKMLTPPIVPYSKTDEIDLPEGYRPPSILFISDTDEDVLDSVINNKNSKSEADLHLHIATLSIAECIKEEIAVEFFFDYSDSCEYTKKDVGIQTDSTIKQRNILRNFDPKISGQDGVPSYRRLAIKRKPSTEKQGLRNRIKYSPIAYGKSASTSSSDDDTSPKDLSTKISGAFSEDLIAKTTLDTVLNEQHNLIVPCLSANHRKSCLACQCDREKHAYGPENVGALEKLGMKEKFKEPRDPKMVERYAWIPAGLSVDNVEEYMNLLPSDKVPLRGSTGEKWREQQLLVQLPRQDLNLQYCRHLETQHRNDYISFINARNEIALDYGYVKQGTTKPMPCYGCGSRIPANSMTVMAPKFGESIGWHPSCFSCTECGEILVDLAYCIHEDQVYCERHYAEQLKPRCSACDELIFSGEYTKAMSKDWHIGHFSCWQCDESLTGQRYVLRDEHPYCVKCYEMNFANTCDECNKLIGIDSKDLSYKERHWHEACFLCFKCRVSLVDKQFGSKAEKIYCGPCYDAQFATRCDACGEVFRAGTKKMEYKSRQWHEKCFCCCTCKTPIGTKSFIPREQEIYCTACYEDKFATRCIKCSKIITTGGVTYKSEPWHRECFTCTHCNTLLAGQRFTSRDDKPYCAECFGELFAKRCTACIKPITGIGGTRFISFEDRHWHNDCFVCAQCKSSLVGKGFITDGADILCPDCAKQRLM